MKLCPLCVVGSAAAVAVGLFAGANLISVNRAEATVATESSAMTATAGPFTVDPVHASVIFRVKHQGVANFYGRFNKISGTFALDADKPEATTIDVKVDTASVDTANTKRDDHLRSDSFYSVKEFPTLSFKSKSAKAGTDGMIAVTGDLFYRGKTKEITVNVENTGKGAGRGGAEIAGLETTFTIKRSDFGDTYYIKEGALGDDVRITVSLEGGRK